ncbi:MAG: hypothetical protein ACE5FD_15350 [Anaerolineae bacterium]
MNVYQKRPFPVTLTRWGVFLFGVWNLGRLAALSRDRQLFQALGVQPDPRWRLGLALVWAILFLGLWLALRRRRPFTRTAVPLTFLLYAVIELAFLTLFAQSAPARQSWVVNTLFYIIVILFSRWALNRTAAKPYFNL